MEEIIRDALEKEKSYYIKLISKKSDRYGDKLLKLMDEYGVNSLREISVDEVKSFYSKYFKGE